MKYLRIIISVVMLRVGIAEDYICHLMEQFLKGTRGCMK